MATKRLFTALPLSDDLHYYFDTLAEDFDDDPNLRWVTPENRHITVHFLGETDENQIPELTRKLNAAAGRSQPFRLVLSEINTLFNGKTANLILAGFRHHPGFETLVNEICKEIGHTPERKPLPHTTIARLKKPRNERHGLPEHEPADSLPLIARQVELWESHAGENGTVFSRLAVFPLQDLPDEDIE